jgi:hypothetical protein
VGIVDPGVTAGASSLIFKKSPWFVTSENLTVVPV